jgi:hypothetical protein
MGTLEPILAVRYRERCREATREGGGPADGEGRWQVPAPIADEGAFRRRVNGGGCSRTEG